MNKRLLAVAVTGALSGVAAAQAEVTISGRLYPQYQTVKVKSATQPGTTVSDLVEAPDPADGPVVSDPSRQNVNSSSSSLVFKASTDLGGGLKGLMQIDSTVPLDEGDGFLADRSTFVGLTGAFGTVYLGRMDTVYKDLGGPVGFLGVSSGNFVSESNIIARTGLPGGEASNTAQFGAGFHRRQNHMVRYETPEFSGVQFLVQYAPDENKTTDLNSNVTSMGVKWESGPLFLALAHEVHKDFFGASLNADVTANAEVNDDDELELLTPGASSKDTATRLSWAWQLGDSTKIGGDFATFKLSESGRAAGSVSEYKNDRWDIGIEQKFGKITVAANYASADEGTCSLVGVATCSTQGLDGNMLSLGVLYSFSKAVGVFGLVSKLENGESARYDNLENGRPQLGEDTEQLAVGILYRF